MPQKRTKQDKDRIIQKIIELVKYNSLDDVVPLLEKIGYSDLCIPLIVKYNKEGLSESKIAQKLKLTRQAVNYRLKTV